MRQMTYLDRIKCLAPALPVLLLLSALPGCGGGGGGGAAPANVTGRIVLVSTGQPLDGATVTIGGVSSVTGANAVGTGNFIINNVSSASTQIVVTGTGLKTLTQTLTALTPNVTNDLGDVFVLDTSDATADYKADVKGTVVRNDTFAPVGGATVRFSGKIVTTSADGTFTITGLPTGLGFAGNGTIGIIRASGFEDKPVTLGGLVLGASPPVNDLGAIPLGSQVSSGTPPPPANIKGKVTLQGLTDLSGTTVTLIKKSDSSTVGTQTTAADGLYGFFVAAGTYTVKVSHAGFTNQQADVTLPLPDQVQTKDFSLVP